MTNITKQKINSSDYALVHKELLKLINKLNTKNAIYLTDELLTDSERVMIIKRFGAIFMYQQNFNPYRVSQTLGISLPTASRVYDKFSAGEYKNLLSLITKKEANDFIELINDLIVAQVSPRARARLMNRVSK